MGEVGNFYKYSYKYNVLKITQYIYIYLCPQFFLRVFSDGGNFCPEEIEDFRKKLEKMGQKIDSAEGYIMSDLEGMESKRLDQATKISAEFEDR